MSLSLIKIPAPVTGTGGGTVLNAVNGTTLADPTTVRLGQDLGASGDPGILTANTEIPTGGNNLYISGTGDVIIGSTTTTGEKLQVTGDAKISNLAGMGKRIVNADSNGVLGIVSGTTDGIYYVSKLYIGDGAAIITGLTFADITSTNSTYNDQLVSAKPGDTLNTYPDPWSARNAALDAITAGSIKTATIVVSGNDFWTVGSDVNTNNGDLVGAPTGHLVADIGFSSANSTTVASLSQNGLTYFFNPVTLIYINATYNIPLSYVVDLTDTAFISRIYGFLNIKQVYGEVNGFFSNLITIDNARSQVLFEFGELFLQQTNGCVFVVNTKLFTLTANNIILPDSIFMTIGAALSGSTSRNGDGDDSIINITANYIQKSSPAFPYPVSNDIWYLLTVDRMEQDRTKNIAVNVNTIFIEGVPEHSLFHGRNSQGNYKNVNYALDIHNFHFKINPSATITADGLIGGALVNVETYLNLSINIDNVVTEAALLVNLVSSGSGKAVITIDVDNGLRLASTETSYGFFAFAGGFSGNLSPATCVIKGFYANENDSAPLITILTNSSFPVNEKIILSGIFKQSSSQPVAIIRNNGPQADHLYLSFNDSTLVNDGTVKSVESESDRNYVLYFKDTHANSIINPNLVVLGEQPIIEAALVNYI